jgi:hypothetical protein
VARVGGKGEGAEVLGGGGRGMSTRGIPVALGDFRSRGSAVKVTKSEGNEQRGARVNE